MLDTFAVELHQEFLDLPGSFRGFLIERDADFTVGGSHRLRGQSGVLTLDVEIADLAKVEQPFVVVGPVFDSTAVDVVGKVIDGMKPATYGVTVDIFIKPEIDIVDRGAVLVSVNKVDGGAADPPDCGQAQLHGAGRDLNRLRAEFQHATIGLVGIANAKTHATGTGAVLLGKPGCPAVRFAVEYKVDIALSVQVNIF